MQHEYTEFSWKTMLSITKIPHNWEPRNLKQHSDCAVLLSKCCKSPSQWQWAVSYILLPVYMCLFLGLHVICYTLYEYKHLHSYHITCLVLCSLQVQSVCLPNIPSLHTIIQEQKSFPISILKPLNKIFMLY